MEAFGYFLVYASVVCCFLVAIILWWFNFDRQLHKYLLAVLFLAMGWFAFTYILFDSRILLKAPYLFRIGVPFYYLIPVLAWYYNRLLLQEEINFSVLILLVHGFPFIVAAIDLLYYYCFNYKQLGKIINHLYQEPDDVFVLGNGFLPAVIHYWCRPVQGCIYMVLTGCSLLQGYRKKRLQQLPKYYFRWLLSLDAFLTCFYLVNYYFTFIGPIKHFTPISENFITAFLIAFCFFMVTVRLFFSPFILYPFQEREKKKEERPDPVLAATVKDNERSELISHKKMLELAQLMDQMMHQEECFKTVTKLADLADKLNTSPRYLSFVLSNHFDQRFNDYVNTFRIAYVIEQMKQGRYRNFTIEALGSEAGFSSRSTFYAAFKKQMGISPSQYLQQFLENGKD